MGETGEISMHDTSYNKIRTVTLTAVLLLFFCAICLINFSAVPSFFDGDMYCDYRYAMETWEHKSIFPEGWVFGNQLNAVSTPVLAALIYGLTHNLNFSTGAACTIMAVMAAVCFDWMIKPAFREKESRLAALTVFVSVSLYCGRAVHGNQGWTLLFTMCSYYAGYSMTAFLAFGCYLRGLVGFSRKQLGILMIACVFSFGTGIQSIRQTAIMIAPILAVEFFRMGLCFRRWKENRQPLWIAIGLTVCNFLGLCYVRMREINQNVIFGAIELTSPGDLKQACADCIYMIKDLLGADHPEAFAILAVLGLACMLALILILKHVREEQHTIVFFLTLLVLFSVLIIVVIDVFTTMFVRPRYYFMLYPLMGLLIAYLYDIPRGKVRWILLVLVVLFAAIAGLRQLTGICTTVIRHEEEESYEISRYLLENGYTTLYAEWNFGQDIAVASNGEIAVGYWTVPERPFEKVSHLCSLDVFESEAEKCAYLFVGEEKAGIGMAAADSAGVPLQLLRYYPDSDRYLYTASSNLMQLLS